MNYTKLKEEIKEIAQIAESVPEPFRLKCFDTLLEHLLASEVAPTPAAATPPTSTMPPAKQTPGADSPPFTVSTQLRVFMQKTDIKLDEITKIVLVADGNVHFVKEPTGKKIAEGQAAWSLLLALKNCILNDSLTVDPETVRSVCQEKGFYDRANFAANFKRAASAKFFKGVLEPQGEAQGLTSEGQAELARLIRELSTTT